VIDPDEKINGALCYEVHLHDPHDHDSNPRQQVRQIRHHAHHARIPVRRHIHPRALSRVHHRNRGSRYRRLATDTRHRRIRRAAPAQQEEANELRRRLRVSRHHDPSGADHMRRAWHCAHHRNRHRHVDHLRRMSISPAAIHWSTSRTTHAWEATMQS